MTQVRGLATRLLLALSPIAALAAVGTAWTSYGDRSDTMTATSQSVTIQTAAAREADTTLDTAAAATATGGTAYYVDAAAGADGNDGLSASTPWRTLARASTVSLQPGDRLLLKAGSVWTGQSLDLTGSGSVGRPIAIDLYGTGAKPRIDFADYAVGGEGFGVRITNGSYWEIRNLEITSGQQATSRRRNGILILGSGAGGGAFRHIHVVGNNIHDIFGNDRRGGGINFHARWSQPTDPESWWDDVLIENNVVDNVADTGIQTMTDALLSSTVNWNRRKTAFHRTVIRRNTVTRIHRDGILVRAAQEPLVEYNTTDQIGRSTTASGATAAYLDKVSYVAAQWMYYVDRGIFQHNQASRTRTFAGDGQAWDFDVGVNNSIYQYNYSFDNDGGAVLVMHTTNGNIFRYNISQNDRDLHRGAVSLDPGFRGTLSVHNNVFYRSRGQNGLLGSAGSSGAVVTYRNNIFVGNGAFQSGSGAVYEANAAFGSGSGDLSDPQKVTTDPQFISPGGATSINDAGVAYRLATGSASRDSGAVLTDNGGIDFAGRVLPASAIDRGAVEDDGGAIAANSNLFENNTLGAWTIETGTMQVGGTPGALQSPTLSADGIATTGDLGWSRYSISAPISVDNAYANAGILFRYTGPTSFLMARLNDQSGRIELLSRGSGGFVTLASAPYPIDEGTFVPLRVDADGQAITVRAAGQLILTATIPAGYPSGRIGVRTARSTARFDEVIIRR